MSHLTDGQLHAFLDGSAEGLDGADVDRVQAHLDVCADCRRRLEAAGVVKQEAAEILGSAGPESLSPPPFAELVSQAAERPSVGARTAGAGAGVRVPSASRRFPPRGSSLAWAASLAVALTAGWLARGMVGTDGTGLAERRLSDALATSPEQEEAGAPGERSPGARSESMTADESTTAEGPAPADRGLRLRAMEAAKSAPRADEPAEPAANSGSATPEGPLRSDGAPLASATVPGEADALGALTRSYQNGDGPEGWRPVGREEAETLLGGSLRAVKDLPVLSIFARATGGPPEVWTAQQLPSGHTLDLRQTPVAAGGQDELEAGVADRSGDHAEAPGGETRQSAEPMTQQAYYESLQLLRIDGFVIEARAPVSADSLQSLLSRLQE